MVTRAALTAATLAIAATALPGVLLGGQQAASASTTAASAAVAAHQAGPPVSVSITSLSSRWASPGGTITVRGTLTNSSSKPVTRPYVQLQSSATPITGIAALQSYADDNSQGRYLGNVAAAWQAKTLPARSSTTWSIRLRVNDVGMTTFGVYPLAALAWNYQLGALATSYSYLPYEPAKRGPYSSSRPARQQVAWVWPLIDKPMLTEPWQSYCQSPQAKALAASLGSGGRLATLLTVGAAGSGPGLAQGVQVTWAVDPALLANASSLAHCGSSYPAGADAASHWLAALGQATRGQPLFVTPYADVNLSAVLAGGLQQDMAQAFSLGWKIASDVLHRTLGPPGTNNAGSNAGKPATVTKTTGNPLTGFAWPADGVPGFTTLEALRPDHITTVLTDSASMPQARSTVVRSPDGNGFMTVLLASDALTQVLGSTASTPGGTFGAEQLFLAETAELAIARPGQPIIVAPPRRWKPPAGFAASLLSESATAPWLSPGSLSGVASARHVPEYQARVKTGYPRYPFSKGMLRQLGKLGKQIRDLLGFQAYPNYKLWEAAATIESSAWDGRSAGTRAALLRVAESYFRQQNAVEIVADNRVTLGGLKGSVPVSIYNRLDYAVRVRVQISPGSSLHVSQSPPGPITVPAHRQQRVELHVQASQVGSASVTLRLLSATGQSLGDKTTMTVQATQLGVLAMIILAVALGVFLIASAARAVRRDRASKVRHSGPATAKAEAEPNAAQAATVVGERTDLRTAGKTGL